MFKAQPLMLVLLACVACGSSFEAGGSGGASSAGGAPQAGETSNGGDTGHGASAGQSSAGSEEAGEANSGGSATAGAGGTGHAGAGGTGHAGAGGTGHAGGASAGGASAGNSAGGASAGTGAGGSAGADCAALKTEYAALVKKARVCDEGSTDECSTTSTAPPAGCGCPTLVNAKSQYTTLAAEKYKAIQKGGCDNGPICDIACPVATTASCTKTSGTGSSEFVCTGTLAVTN